MRARRAALTLFSDVVRTGVAVALGFIATPFLIQWLGPIRFGAYRASLDWVGYLLLLEFGVNGALLPMLARSVVSPEPAHTARVLASGIRALTKASFVALVCGVGLALAIPRLVPVGEAVAADLRWGVLVGVVGLVLMPLGPFRLLQEARQRGYIIGWMYLAQSVLVTGLALLLAWMGWGITGQFLAVLAGTLPFHLSLAVMGARATPGLMRHLFTRAPAQEQGEIKRLGSSAFALSACGRAALLTDNLVVAYFLGPAIVVPFFVTQRLASFFLIYLQAVGNAAWAGLAELFVQENHEAFNARVIDLTRIVSVVGMAGLIPIVAYTQPFVRLWVGSEYFGGWGVALLAALNAYLLAIFSLWGWCFSGTGHYREAVVPTVIATAVNVVASVALVRPLGMIGPLVGTLLGFAIVNVWYLPVLMQRLFGTDARELLFSVLLPLPLAVPYGAGVYWGAATQEDVGWIGLLAGMIVAAVSFLGLSWVLIVPIGARRTFLAYLNSVLVATVSKRGGPGN